MTTERSRRYKVFFVETPSPEENCFVIAATEASAAKLEQEETGFNPGDCHATYVRDVEPKWLNRYLASYPEPEASNAWYLTNKIMLSSALNIPFSAGTISSVTETSFFVSRGY